MDEQGSAESKLAFNPFSDEYRQSRYELLAQLRRREPAHRSPLGFLLLTKYRDVQAVLRSEDFGVMESAAQARFPEGSRISRICRDAFLFKNEPDHLRLRSIVNRSFSPRRVASLNYNAERQVDMVLARFEANGGGEVVADLASRVPLAMICDVVGIPESDREQVLAWSNELCPALEPVVPPHVAARLDCAVEEFEDYLKELGRRRGWGDEESLLATCTKAVTDGMMHESELLASIVLVLAAGLETTSSLIATGVYQLSLHVDQHELLRRNPQHIDSSVEELLRYESPIAMFMRWARCDLSLDGMEVREGDPVALHIGAANRDPDVFSEPDELNLFVERVPHIAFGDGVHRCVGPALARLEAVAVLRGIVARRWDLIPVGLPEWRDTITLRALKRLEIQV